MFIVIEYQTNAEGQTAMLNNAYADSREAESKYHQILSAAALSGLPKHGAIMFTEDGFIGQSCYTNQT